MPGSADTDFLTQLLKPERLSTVVDIGANPIDGDPPYKKMLTDELCQVIGFEPQEDALEALLKARGPLEEYLPYAIGDGRPHSLYRCSSPGMTSLYEPDRRHLAALNDMVSLGHVESVTQVETRRLDDIAEVGHMDMLKIDIQGSELSVFQSGRSKLKDTVAIQTEVSLIPLYSGQPLNWEIERELRDQGFIPHAFYSVKRWPITPYAHPDNRQKAVNQVIEADMIYVRDFINPDTLSPEQLKQLALLAYHCYSSHDLVMRCLDTLANRQLIRATAVRDYEHYIFPKRKPPSQELSYSMSYNLKR